SVTEPVEGLARQGFSLDRLPVDSEGIVQSGALPELFRPDTRLVVVMLANNETGAIQPVRQLATELEERAAFHCDAAQAVGRMPVNFGDLRVTTLALSA